MWKYCNIIFLSNECTLNEGQVLKQLWFGGWVLVGGGGMVNKFKVLHILVWKQNSENYWKILKEGAWERMMGRVKLMGIFFSQYGNVIMKDPVKLIHANKTVFKSSDIQLKLYYQDYSNFSLFSYFHQGRKCFFSFSLPPFLYFLLLY
jgi:hypothetical protein